jgi:hypothetical protein
MYAISITNLLPLLRGGVLHSGDQLLFFFREIRLWETVSLLLSPARGCT